MASGQHLDRCSHCFQADTWTDPLVFLCDDDHPEKEDALGGDLLTIVNQIAHVVSVKKEMCTVQTLG